MQGLSVLIPAFNEEVKLRESVSEVIKAVQKYGHKYEILIINTAQLKLKLNNTTTKTEYLFKIAN